MSQQKRNRFDPVLVAIRKETRPTDTKVVVWGQLFVNGPIMSVLIPMLHLYDIIHLAQTCRSCYTFYFGDTLQSILCAITHRYTGIKYSTCPLRWLGRSRNASLIVSGSSKPYYTIMKCFNCSTSTSKLEMTRHQKGLLCNTCERLFGYFNDSVRWRDYERRDLMRDENGARYQESSCKRIDRLVSRAVLSLIRSRRRIDISFSDLKTELRYLDLERQTIVVASVPAEPRAESIEIELDLINKKRRIDHDQESEEFWESLLLAARETEKSL